MEINDWFEEGNDWLNKRDYSKAIEYFDKAIDLNPNYIYAYLFKGLALCLLDKEEEAIQCFDKAIALNPDNALAYNNKGFALKILGKYEEAIECYDKAIALNPDNANAHYGKGIALKILGKYEEAIECYDEAIALKPDYADAHYSKGFTLEKLGNYKEAIECYDRTLAIEPNYYEAGTRRSTIMLNMPANEKEEYKNEKLQEFDKILNYGFAVAFSDIDKGELEQKIVSKIPKDTETARQRIDKTISDYNTLDYETQIAKCTPDEFPIAIIIYYYITGKISSDTASTLLLYCAKKMDNDSIKKFGNVIKAVSPQLHILFACVEFLSSLQSSFTTEIWKEVNEYELFKINLPKFLAEERKRMKNDEFVAKYYFVDYLKEYRKIFE